MTNKCPTKRLGANLVNSAAHPYPVIMLNNFQINRNIKNESVLSDILIVIK